MPRTSYALKTLESSTKAMLRVLAEVDHGRALEIRHGLGQTVRKAVPLAGCCVRRPNLHGDPRMWLLRSRRHRDVAHEVPAKDDQVPGSGGLRGVAHGRRTLEGPARRGAVHLDALRRQGTC